MFKRNEQTLTERIVKSFMGSDKNEQKERNDFSKSDNMKKLKELTHTLQPLPLLVKSEEMDRIDYNIYDGISFALNLMNQRNVAVSNCFISKGAMFPKHDHQETELLIVYDGSLYVEICNDVNDTCYFKNTINVGEVVYFEAGEKHIIKALEDTWMIAITVPAAEGYPSG